jgi:hypothetical protein
MDESKHHGEQSRLRVLPPVVKHLCGFNKIRKKYLSIDWSIVQMAIVLERVNIRRAETLGKL